MLLQLQRDGDVGKMMKGNDEYGYMYIGGRAEGIWKSMKVSNVGGNSQGIGGGQQSGGCGSEEGAVMGNGADTRELTMVTRYDLIMCNVVLGHGSCFRIW